jgi:hypothetical protein
MSCSSERLNLSEKRWCITRSCSLRWHVKEVCGLCRRQLHNYSDFVHFCALSCHFVSLLCTLCHFVSVTLYQQTTGARIEKSCMSNGYLSACLPHTVVSIKVVFLNVRFLPGTVDPNLHTCICFKGTGSGLLHVSPVLPTIGLVEGECKKRDHNGSDQAGRLGLHSLCCVFWDSRSCGRNLSMPGS